MTAGGECPCRFLYRLLRFVMQNLGFSRATCLSLAVLTACLLTSCSLFGDSSPASQDGVIARDVGDAIVIENRRSAPIWADLYASGFLATALLARPSFRGDSIPPGGTRSTPLDSIPGLHGSEGAFGTDIRVLWYEADFRNGERVPPDDHNGFTIER